MRYPFSNVRVHNSDSTTVGSTVVSPYLFHKPCGHDTGRTPALRIKVVIAMHTDSHSYTPTVAKYAFYFVW